MLGILLLVGAQTPVQAASAQTAPVAANDFYSLNEGATVTATAGDIPPGLLDNDSDADGDNLTAIKLTDPQFGSVTVNANGTFTYTHNGSETTEDAFTYRASDGFFTSNDATVILNINPVNDPPVANNDAFAVNEGGTFSSPAPGVLGNDTDAESSTLSANLETGPSHAASFTLNPNGSFTYVHDGSGSTTDAFTYTANDGGEASNPATVSITINPINDPPTTTGIANVTVNEDAAPTSVSLAAAFDDEEDPDEALAFAVQNNTNPGLVSTSIQSNGTLVLTYVTNASGSSTITVRATDTENLFAETSFTVTVNPANDPPSFTKGPNQTVSEDSGPSSIPGWATNMSPGPPDEANQSLSFVVTTNNDALFSTPPAVSPQGALTFTPGPDRFGTATVTVVLQDNGGTANGGTNQSPPQTFSIVITPVNDPPVSSGINDVNTTEDAPATAIDLNQVFDDDEDPDQNLQFSAQNSNPSLLNAALQSNGILTLNLVPNASGTATVTVRATDTDNASTETDFTVTVAAVNDAPTFTKGGNQTVDEDAGPQTVIGWATGISPGPADEASQTLSFNVTADTPGLFAAGPAVSSNGTLTYTPAPDAFGSTVVTVVLQDNGGTANGGTNQSPPQTFTLTLNPVDDPPIATNDAYSVNEGGTILASPGGNPPGVVDNDVDPDGTGTLVATVVSQPSQASSFILQPNGTFTYTHNGSETTSDSFTYRVSDGSSPSNVATVTITVIPVNDPPTTTGLSDVAVLEDADAVPVNLAAAFNDPDNPDTDLTFTADPGYDTGLVTPSFSGGQLTLSFVANAFGTTALTVRGTDPGGQAAAASFSITVTSVNDPPSMVPGTTVAIPEDQGPQAIENWAQNIVPGPPNEASQTLNITVSFSNQALFLVSPTLAQSGTLSFTPNPGQNGQSDVTFTLTDNGGTANGGANVATYSTTIIISSDNDPPMTTGIEDLLVREDSTNIPPINLFAVFEDEEDPDEALAFSVELVSDPTLFAVPPAIDAAAGTLTLTLALDAFGTSMVRVRATDSGSLQTDADFEVTVQPVNDPPTVTLGPNPPVPATGAPVTIENWATGITPGPPNEAEQSLSFTVTTDNDALFTVLPTLDLAGTLSYTLAESAHGAATVTVILSDDGGTENGGTHQSAPQTFSILGFNTAPVANDDEYFVQGNSLSIPATAGVLVNDTDADGDAPLTAYLVAEPVNGEVLLREDGSFVYTHGGSGTTDAFTYEVSDGFETSNPATVRLTINNSTGTTLIVVGFDDVTVQEDAEDVLVDLFAGFDSTVDDDEDLQYQVEQVQNPALFRAVTIDSTAGKPAGTLTLSFAPNAFGTSRIVVRASDSAGASEAAAFEVVVNPVNDPPVAVDDRAATFENEPVTINLLANDFHPDGPDAGLKFVRLLNEINAERIDVLGNNTVVYHPPEDFIGEASFDYIIQDNDNEDDRATVRVTVFRGTFNITDLGPTEGTESRAYRINNEGTAVGVYSASGTVRPFATLAPLDDTAGEAWGLNDEGTVVGSVAINGTFRAVAWGTNRTELDIFDGRTSTAFNINAAGQIAGTALSGDGDAALMRGFRWSGGSLDTLSAPVNVHSFAFDINEQGHLAGYAGARAGVWQATDAFVALDGTNGIAYSLNNNGQAVGSQATETSVQARLWNYSAGGFTDLDDTGRTFSEAYGVNDAGWVVGTLLPAGAAAKQTTGGASAGETALALRALALPVSLRQAAGTGSDAAAARAPASAMAHDRRAFLWRNGALLDLNEKIDAASGWVLVEARDVNNGAQIVGYGLLNGNPRAFLLTPTLNKAPKTENDAFTLDHLAPIVLDVLENDLDDDGDSLRVLSVSAAQNGTVVLNPDQTVTYTPPHAFTGPDTFTYTASDGRGGHSEATVTITLNPDAAAPKQYTLAQNYPNPFNPVTTITYALPNPGRVVLDVYNMLGQRVAILLDEEKPAGTYLVTFDASGLSGGTYVYRIRSGTYTRARTFVLLK